MRQISSIISKKRSKTKHKNDGRPPDTSATPTKYNKISSKRLGTSKQRNKSRIGPIIGRIENIGNTCWFSSILCILFWLGNGALKEKLYASLAEHNSSDHECGICAIAQELKHYEACLNKNVDGFNPLYQPSKNNIKVI